MDIDLVAIPDYGSLTVLFSESNNEGGTLPIPCFAASEAASIHSF